MKATITTTTATAEQYVGWKGKDFELVGTWDGALIDLQVKTLNTGEWATLATYTENTVDQTIDGNSARIYRFKASAVGASTDVDVAIDD